MRKAAALSLTALLQEPSCFKQNTIEDSLSRLRSTVPQSNVDGGRYESIKDLVVVVLATTLLRVHDLVSPADRRRPDRQDETRGSNPLATKGNLEFEVRLDWTAQKQQLRLLSVRSMSIRYSICQRRIGN